ncbi:SMI1/KNR4 family protein [Kitasatospora sp. MY 5-36]|uniref:SMI1/KNR4 family protein n=1 Tax=Kitasatospora sp. MY 5-36 TaxID=1678027 RepID=UPI000670F523|nr:SMI1/KNR4 family protein [Kitasatospora sp. MY 5-36]
MWRQAAREAFPDAGFAEPADESVLAEAERKLGEELPSELRQLLLESNGIVGRTSVDTVWTVEQIVEQNLHFRTDGSFARLYMPFDALLFFGDNGGGDQFAFVRTPRRLDVFVWEHETDSRRWVAGGLRDYLGRSLADGGDDWYR